VNSRRAVLPSASHAHAVGAAPSLANTGSVYWDTNGNAAAGGTLFNGAFTGVGNVGLGLESRVGFRVVRGLALFEPFVELAGVGVNRGSLLVPVAANGKAFGLFPALCSANFAAEVNGNLFPRNEFLVAKARPFEVDRGSASRHEGRQGIAFR